MGNLDRLGIVRRNDDPHADARLVELFLCKPERHAHAAVGSCVSGKRSAVQRDAVPCDALHVRHRGVVIHRRIMFFFLFDDGEDAGWRLASGGAGRDRSPNGPTVRIVESDVLGLDRYDGHDGFACRARCRRLDDARRPFRSRRRVSRKRRQAGHCCECDRGRQ